MSIAGRLDITLHCRQGQVRDVAIVSTRPLAITQSFRDQSVEDLQRLIPLLFAVCGHAHAFAALLALDRARELPPSPKQYRIYGASMLLETMREHSCRILTGATDEMGLETRAFAQLRQLENAFRPAIAAGQSAHGLIEQLELWLNRVLFGGQLDAWRQIDSVESLLQWSQQHDAAVSRWVRWLVERQWHALGSNTLSSLPSSALHLTAEQTDPDAFCRQPTWYGECRETTALSRRLTVPLIADCLMLYGNGLLTRLLARCTELARIPLELRQLLIDETSPPFLYESLSLAQTGLAQVQAARGLLIHQVKLANERVQDYRIVAPTEWNFHPQGIVVQALKQLSAENEELLRQQAACVIEHIDPCVGFELSIRHERDKMQHYA